MAEQGDARSDGFESTISADTELAGEDDALPEGTMLAGRYRIEGTLGTGGMGRVYRARDLELARMVALKTMRRSASADARRRFRREVKLALRITHPNVVRLFDLGSSDGTDFVTMEIVRGESLRHRLHQGPLEPQRVAEIGSQVARGLAAAHEAGVIHRDLKPENIIIAGDRVVVVDFGVAGEEVAGKREASAIVGTSAYMSPEQANGEVSTARTDLYALGLVLYELLTGEVPLVANGPVATALRRQREKPPSVRRQCPDAPRALDSLINRLLAVSADARPADATTVAETLAAIADGDPATPAKRWRWSVAVVAVVAVIAVAATWLLTRRSHDAGPAAPHKAAVDRTADLVLAVAPNAGAQLDPALAFVAPHVRAAAFRALAARLPGRVTLADDRGAAPVQVTLAGKPGAVRATFACAGRVVSGTGATPVAALDHAAKLLIDDVLPDGPAATARERALRAAWGARDATEVRAYLRLQMSAARRHPHVSERAAALGRRGFVRPYMLAMMALGALGPRQAKLVATAREHAATAPARERTILSAIIGVLANDAGPARAIDPAWTDVWSIAARAWRAAYTDQLDDAFSLTAKLGRDPEVAGVGVAIALELTRYYRATALVSAAEELVNALTEEPRAWLELASARAAFESAAPALQALERARLLGARGGTFEEVEAAIALVALDFSRARAAALRLIGRSELPWQLEGQRVLYATDVMTGRFADAAKRADTLGRLIQRTGTVEAAEAGLWLSQDALVRNELGLARRFATWARRAADAVSDREYAATAQAMLATVDLAAHKLDPAAFQKRLAEVAAYMRRHGHNPESRVTIPMARLRAARLKQDCAAMRRAARGFERQTESIAALAECDLAQDHAARALSRLSGMFRGVELATAPTLFVRHELALGRAYAALGKGDRARAHLRRVISMWRYAPDRGEVARAQRLLLTLSKAPAAP